MDPSISQKVYIIDDELLVRATLTKMLRANGFIPVEFCTAEDFLTQLEHLEPGCTITDVRMPGMSGLELVRHLKAQRIEHPVIVISGQGDIPLAVEAMKAGAVDFLEKPLRTAMILQAVESAVQRASIPSNPETGRTAQIFQTLTRRQIEVLKGIVEGLPNKLIAYRLGLSTRTVEAYRAAIMERTQAKSLSELVRISIKAGL